ncbi:unnamed protein product [Acanthoscelides obtectus]|uniref:Uncharacterized protein n=1 Tax=Acanthoscelides obtectus TaxID=200917 RepID=A0A9P0KXI3_ACAOB|nr:unnamed protein product [Acanthoscelides obtectus]CAK1654573.1 hypothetical protein AOBTE_LOCUS18686 [Acanthoscelides obtectus]
MLERSCSSRHLKLYGLHCMCPTRPTIAWASIIQRLAPNGTSRSTMYVLFSFFRVST